MSCFLFFVFFLRLFFINIIFFSSAVEFSKILEKNPPDVIIH